MNISRKWLHEFVDIQATDKEYDETMTIAGQKVETTTRMDAEIQNVVVGKVLSMKRHENSDHMWVCMVDVGKDEPLQIVTGAQNVHEGDLVPAALHNSHLPGGIHITKGKLRGVESNGMLCSYKELGLTSTTARMPSMDGIWILNNEGCKPSVRTSTRSSETTTPSWILRSPTTVPTAIPSSVWRARPQPPSTSP